MSQNVVLRTEGKRPDDTAQAAADLTGPLSLVRPLPRSAASDGLLFQQLSASSSRPFDAQYWACWAAVVLVPLLMVYLGLLR